MLISLFGILIILLLLGVPIAISVGMAVIIALAVNDPNTALMVIPQRMFTSLDTFPFLAVPFFVLAGNLMERGGISKRLIRLGTVLLKKIPAAMACVTTVCSAFFGAISGSNPATVAAIGGIMIPEMKRKGYPADRAGAIAASSGTLGVVIPPSIPMVTYSVTAFVSTGAMFMAGFVPGIMLAVAIIIVHIFLCSKYEKQCEPADSQDETVSGETNESMGRKITEAVWALLMPGIILGGIYGGIFTPTEAAAVSCLYAVIISVFVYKELRFSDMREILGKSAVSTALVLLVCSVSSPFSWVMTSAGLPGRIASTILALFHSKLLILFMMNLVLLFLGCFLETQAIILLITPILLPLATELGLPAIALGIIIVINTSIGMITPPMAVNLFVASEISGVSIINVSKRIIPYLAAEMAVLLLLTYAPDIIMWFPRLMGIS